MFLKSLLTQISILQAKTNEAQCVEEILRVSPIVQILISILHLSVD